MKCQYLFWLSINADQETSQEVLDGLEALQLGNKDNGERRTITVWFPGR